MKTLHNIRVDLKSADSIVAGDKNFVVIHNDGYQKGDTVEFEVIDSQYSLGNILLRSHALIEQLYEITYVESGKGIELGYVVLGIILIESEILR